MSTWKIIGGIVIGVGAVAAVPFTGGGSLLGGASLAASLTGAATAATAAGVAGGVTGAVIGEEEKKRKKKAEKNNFEEGVKAGEATVKEKLHSILSTQRKRDEFLLLVVKLGTHIAKCDGDFADEERKEIDSFIGKIVDSPFVPEVIQKRILEIINSEITFEDIVDTTKQLIKNETESVHNEVMRFIDSIIQSVVYCDGVKHQKEEEFIVKWNKEFVTNG